MPVAGLRVKRMDPRQRRKQVEQHLDEIRKLEAQSVTEDVEGAWPAPGTR